MPILNSNSESRKKFNRRKSAEIFKKVIYLRKSGCSYTEIRNATGIAKSTINNWLKYAGLTLTPEHFLIQGKKSAENYVLGTEASRITRARRRAKEIEEFIQEKGVFFGDALFIAGIMLYEAEGTKSKTNGFSNSDFRLVKLYIKFLEKYFLVDKDSNLKYRLYIHDSRKIDLGRITNFWATRLNIKPTLVRISWKHNMIARRRQNPDYVGQLQVNVVKFPYFLGKILAISDIILSGY